MQGFESDETRNLHFYVSMLVGQHWNLVQHPTALIEKAVTDLVKPIPVKILDAAGDKARMVYHSLGPTDQSAKSVEMRNKVLGA